MKLKSFLQESSTALPEFLGATDVVTCKIKAVLSRKAHMNADFDAEALNAKSVRVRTFIFCVALVSNKNSYIC